MIFEDMTENITVQVEPAYVGQQFVNDVANNVWAYRITISNNGLEDVQVMNRNCRLIDQFGLIKELKGDGVVGQHPIIRPGESYEYTSLANLLGEHGIIEGSYEIESISGNRFVAKIPAFALDNPNLGMVLN
jgi:ApaG protein